MVRVDVVLGLGLGTGLVIYGLGCAFQRNHRERELLAWVREHSPKALEGLPWYLRKLMSAELVLAALSGKRLITEPVFRQRYQEVRRLRYKTITFITLGLVCLYAAIARM